MVVALPFGPDVASYQGRVNWDAVKQAGAEFGFTKATEGTDYINPMFTHNWQGMESATIYRGAYHFARPDLNYAEDEARYFYNTVEGNGINTGDILALDLENYQGSLDKVKDYIPVKDWTITFITELQKLCGFYPILYTNRSIIEQYELNDFILGEYGLWLADWGTRMPPGQTPWEFIAFWQYTDKGRLPGIEGAVDLNRFNGTADRIPLYGKP